MLEIKKVTGSHISCSATEQKQTVALHTNQKTVRPQQTHVQMDGPHAVVKL